MLGFEVRVCGGTEARVIGMPKKQAVLGRPLTPSSEDAGSTSHAVLFVEGLSLGRSSSLGAEGLMRVCVRMCEDV